MPPPPEPWEVQRLRRDHWLTGRRQNAEGGAHPLRVDAFCLVATAALLPEARRCVEAIRRHHPQHPILLVCDEGVGAMARDLARSGMRGLTIFDVMTPATLQAAAQDCEAVTQHGAGYWKADVIWFKVWAWGQAMALWPGRGVLLLDSDVLVMRTIYEQYDADVVLSPFHWWDPSQPVVAAHGLYNAGYLLGRHPGAAVDWMSWYTGGIGGFYEQKCLELLPAAYRCDFFGRAHNWGIWRKETPQPRDKVASVHIHLECEPQHNIAPVNQGLREFVWRHLAEPYPGGLS